MSNINDTYFDGHYKEIWRTMIPEEHTQREVDFIITYFKLQPGDHVLDLMCGYGRHALALARKGINVTAVDNLEEYIHEIKENAIHEKLPLKTVTADVLVYKPKCKFDLVICMGNSMNFFNSGDIRQILDIAGSSLSNGGNILINTWSLAETVIKNFREKSWSIVNDIKCLTNSRYLFHPSRIETESIFITPNGIQEAKTAIDYIYSVNEMESLLLNAGFALTEIYTIPGKKKFGVGDPKAYIIAKK